MGPRAGKRTKKINSPKSGAGADSVCVSLKILRFLVANSFWFKFKIENHSNLVRANFLHNIHKFLHFYFLYVKVPFSHKMYYYFQYGRFLLLFSIQLCLHVFSYTHEKKGIERRNSEKCAKYRLDTSQPPGTPRSLDGLDLIVITQKQWVQANRANNSKTMGYSQETSRVTTTNSVHNAASLSMLCCF